MQVNDRVMVSVSVAELEGATGTVVEVTHTTKWCGELTIVRVRLDDHVEWGWRTPTFVASSLKMLTNEDERPQGVSEIVFDHVWVNDGGWRVGSDMELSVDAAKRRVPFGHEMIGVNIRRVAFDQRHTDACFHAVVVVRFMRNGEPRWRS